ncbi:chromobox protein 3-like [Aphis craccivora]|uniref:Chromobox protein 3-like n=1 Tax=Aphis craccivora TaxID=307492 RepID=A0A6G0Y377_APHCR|nr:chromobox protein 3-like [Aphis craccivora]
MSANPNTVVPENGLNDCTAQPPKDDAAAAAAACSEQPSLNGVARASSPSNVDSVVSSENGDHVSAAASSIAPSSMDETVPVDVPDVEIAGPSSSSYSFIGNDEVSEPVRTKKLVGYDRGLEVDHIVGATEKDGKLMFLIAWKNSPDGKTDLLEATEVYERSPQVAIKFFEDKLIFISPTD